MFLTYIRHVEFLHKLNCTKVIRSRLDKEANTQISDLCENMILGVTAGIESNCENKK